MGGFTNKYMTKRQVYRLDLFPWKMERVLWISFVYNSIFSVLPAELIRIIIKKLK